MGNVHMSSSRPVPLRRHHYPSYSHSDSIQDSPRQPALCTESSMARLGDCKEDRPSQSTFYTENTCLGESRDSQEDTPRQSTFYVENINNLGDSRSSSESLSDESWVSAASTQDPALHNPQDTDGALANLFCHAGEEDQFLQAVLSFCSHMGGRLESLDNAHIYEEFRSYTDTGHDDVMVAHPTIVQ